MMLHQFNLYSLIILISLPIYQTEVQPHHFAVPAEGPSAVNHRTAQYLVRNNPLSTSPWSSIPFLSPVLPIPAQAHCSQIARPVVGN